MSDFVPADQSARDAALDPARSVILQAPAGSGKTGLLTQRFLKLLAVVEHPEEIVAITFTRKAAAEMRERILGAMRDARDEKPLRDGANERRTRELARAALAADARREWGLLDNPARLRVTTIDAFNTMLARQLPVRSGFGQAPAIAEQSAELCEAAAHRLLRKLDASDEPGPALRILLAHLDNRLDELAALLATMLARRDLWLQHLEIGGLDREALEAALAHEVETVLGALDRAFPRDIRERIVRIVKDCQRNLAECGKRHAVIEALAAFEGFPGSKPRDLAHWQKLAEFFLTSAGGLRKTGGLNVNMGFPSAKDAGIGPEAKAAREAHKAAMAEVLAALEDAPAAVALLARVGLLPPAHYTDAQWRVLEALNACMPHAVVALQEIFRDRGEVDFPELAIRARAALGDADRPTDLALRLDYRIRHLLVDEFQDTSYGQIDLLLRLTRGWTPGDGRTLFLVGDPMQSIYQFREAEVGHFLAVRDNGLGELELDSLRLSANFRSQRRIVEWVNRAFGGGDGAPGILPARDDIAMGAIAFEPSQPVHAALDGDAVAIHAFEQFDFDAEAARVVELVREAAGDPDNGTTAVLVRGRAHLARILPLLRESGIPFRAVELDSLETVPVVQDLMALARVLVNPADATALFAVLRAPWCGMELADLVCFADREGDLFETLHDPRHLRSLSAAGRQRLERLRAVLDAAEARRGRASLRERVETAWFALAGPAALNAREDLENARLFFELLGEVETAGDVDDVNALDARLQQLFSAPDPDAGEAVQVMTLHKAKGLQFDTVIIPALDQTSGRKDRLLFHWIERPRPDGREHVLLGPLKSPDDEEGGAIYRFIERLKEEKEALERARLLYVGITRAKRRVHLTAKARRTTVNGAVALAPPAAGSLLELLWPLPEVRAAFEALPVPSEKPQRAQRVSGETPLRRLPLNWQAPALPPGPEIAVHPRGTGSDAERVPYEWAGDRVRHVGTLVHRCLERMAADALDGWNERRVRELPLESQLAALGLPEDECADAADDVRRALLKVLASEKARWLLGSHAFARNEWALGGVDRGERVSVSIDRSFVDDEGVRWIVDYKTSTHEGGGLDAFLDQQRERYRHQLERYARLVRALEDRPIKVALYFPLQDAFLAWDPAAAGATAELD